jgi:hypothetical protein
LLRFDCFERLGLGERSLRDFKDCCGSDILSGLTGRLGLFGRMAGHCSDGDVCVMVGSLTSSYRRKRNVGGRVVRNICEDVRADTLADTFREKMLHASDRKIGCKV